MTRARVVFALSMLLSFAVSVRQQGFSIQADYLVYYTAGMLVHQHMGDHLYDRPDAAIDPILRLSDPGTPLARTGATRGIKPIVTYVYPPLLADLMVPISLLPPLQSTIVWRLFNTGLLFLSASLLGSLLGLRRRRIIFLFFAMFFFTPVAECLNWGQIGIVLLTCWVGGIVCYLRGQIAVSALLLALATAIKLTPAMAIFPFLLWGEWKWLRWYAAGLAASIAVVLLSSGPVPLTAYFLHILPTMAPGVANFQNKSISSALQLVVLALQGHDLAQTNLLLFDNVTAPPRLVSPAWVLLVAKAMGAGCLAWAMWLVFRLRRSITAEQRLWVLAATATLSIALSPVSWRHSYCMALPLLVVAWRNAFRRRPTNMELALLGIFSVSVGSFLVDSVAGKLAHGALLGAAAGFAPIVSVLFVLYQLVQMAKAAHAGQEIPSLRSHPGTASA